MQKMYKFTVLCWWTSYEFLKAVFTNEELTASFKIVNIEGVGFKIFEWRVSYHTV